MPTASLPALLACPLIHSTSTARPCCQYASATCAQLASYFVRGLCRGVEPSRFSVNVLSYVTNLCGEQHNIVASRPINSAFADEAKPLHSLLVLGKSLGSGAFGTVHEARWGNQPCAAKTFFGIQFDFQHDAIQKEISVLQTLRYRHVIQFYRTLEEDGRIYLLMELAEKGSLARAITKGELAPDDWVTKKRLASEIARGLAYIHQERVLHRDLKSANVLLTNRMEVKLADFGLAKVRSMASAASAANASGVGLKGTLRWTAPELLF
ncbi:hypothetical protein BGZ73_000593, partial [Actinomortierella ambigua]